MAGSSALEVEAKFDVDAGAQVPDLAGLPGVVAADAATRVRLDATYFDTPALDLLALGITLRRRHGGADAGWHLKVPADHGRLELHEPLEGNPEVPPRLRLLVRGITRGAELVEVATIGTLRSLTALRGVDGSVVAEFCDDRVRAVRPRADGPSSTQWREWELELVRGDDRLLAAGARLLVEAGATPSRSGSKLARALTDSPAASVTSVTAEPDVRRTDTARDVLGAFLDDQIRRLRGLDPLVRAGAPDANHQMRVTCRRIRAVLACFRRDFRGGQPRHLCVELGWLVDRLGMERDLEVLRGRVGGMIGPPDGGPPRDAADDWIDRELADLQDGAHDTVVETLSTDRYEALLGELDRPGAGLAWSERADRRASKELRRALHHEWHRLLRAAATADRRDGAERDDALHTVRKSAKRLRYAAEAVSPVLGDRSVAVVQAMRSLQDVLGRMHDAVVTDQALRRLAQEHPGPQHEAVVAGLLDQLARDKREDGDRYHDVERRFARSGAARWLA